MLTHLAFVGGRVTVALAALNVGASAFTVGVLASLFAVVPMFLSVTMGRLVDRIGVRGPMTVGAAGMAAGWALAFFLPQLAILALATTAGGMGCQFSPGSLCGNGGTPPDAMAVPDDAPQPPPPPEPKTSTTLCLLWAPLSSGRTRR